MESSGSPFVPNMNESYILSRFDSLVGSGTVQYDHEQEIVERTDGELKFRFILTSSLSKKPTFHNSSSQTHKPQKTYDQIQTVSDIDTTGYEIDSVLGTHNLVANKYCYARPHLMLLTNDECRRQYAPLQEDDFAASWTLLTALGGDYVAFYNCGKDGGCSRLHKHLQLMPMPTDTLTAFLDSAEGMEPNVPFKWFFQRFDLESVNTEILFQAYNRLLRQASATSERDANSLLPGAVSPHNCIFTGRWMMVIPRQQGAVDKKVGANALGMLGFVAVSSREEIDCWVEFGLINALREFGVPK